MADKFPSSTGSLKATNNALDRLMDRASTVKQRCYDEELHMSSSLTDSSQLRELHIFLVGAYRDNETDASTPGLKAYASEQFSGTVIDIVALYQTMQPLIGQADIKTRAVVDTYAGKKLTEVWDDDGVSYVQYEPDNVDVIALVSKLQEIVDTID